MPDSRALHQNPKLPWKKDFDNVCQNSLPRPLNRTAEHENIVEEDTFPRYNTLGPRCYDGGTGWSSEELDAQLLEPPLTESLNITYFPGDY